MSNYLMVKNILGDTNSMNFEDSSNAEEEFSKEKCSFENVDTVLTINVDTVLTINVDTVLTINVNTVLTINVDKEGI